MIRNQLRIGTNPAVALGLRFRLNPGPSRSPKGHLHQEHFPNSVQNSLHVTTSVTRESCAPRPDDEAKRSSVTPRAPPAGTTVAELHQLPRHA
jgi:hypothetical protein